VFDPALTLTLRLRARLSSMATASDQLESPVVDPAAELLRRQIVGALEATVRPRDASGLTLRILPPTQCGVTLVVRHRVTFEKALGHGQGPLPDEVQDVSSRDNLAAGVEQQHAAAVDEAGGFIEDWVGREGHDYRADLTPDDCHGSRPTLGFQQDCPGCGGRQHVTCGICQGHGQHTCTGCHGAGRTTCTSCHGSGSTMCFSCGGSGTREVREFEMSHSDHQNTMNQREVIRRVPCGAGCSSGRVPCSCNAGMVTCTSCGGQRIVSCATCGATGQVPCSTCAATGAIHQYGRVVCSVARANEVKVASDAAEDRQTVRERVPLAELGALADLHLATERRDALDLALTHEGEITVRCAEASIGQETLTIRAYGPQRRIYDYHDLAGKWLLPDVAQLEGAASAHSLLSMGEASGLTMSLRHFLGSELNVRIAEGHNESLQEFLGPKLVSPAYAERASTALTKSLPRIYIAQLAKRAVWLPPAALAGTVLTYGVVRLLMALFHWFPWSKFQFALMGFAIFGGAWAFFEFEAASRLKQLLGAELYGRVGKAFQAARTQVRWGAGIALVLLAWMYGYLPSAVEQLFRR